MMNMNTFSQYEYQANSGQQRSLAFQMFGQARSNARLSWIKNFFSGKRRMSSLAGRIAGHTVRAQHSLGLHSVEVKAITGTESRADDFDTQFNPRADRIQDRWVRIAEMRLRQAYLPAVELIQVGSEYFVRDGHHRVSVARALGNAFIDAQVILIELA